MEPKVIFEDEYILVIDKPSGWVVNDADTTKNIITVQGWLAKNCKYELAQDSVYRSGIVHRLDKETSGVLIIAKTKDLFTNLQAQFKNRQINKSYIALVHGIVDPPAGGEGEINIAVGRLPWNRRRFGVLPGGREAITRYRVNSNYQFLSEPESSLSESEILPSRRPSRRLKSNEKYTLLELYPKTGRTHQLRIHLKYLGHPIVSDGFYAGRKTSREDLKWCNRMFLHAQKIQFSHPINAKPIEIESPIPADLVEALKLLSEIT
ncbi:hypothetical protein A3A76_02435 [Candidatus Woesebacteria bacterium RIFCSPLOWO2_01_FULL_39_23]|uniref:Pseudouridine synthase RsuA/RluA-like domain-containing protein n=1 Tax=Candidatus Woesebacteria bacterium RIFCSPHIGHO2_01_FULL_40_22 TaxID=1802499 RepID=A0A1F7YJ07_9BACT|nr:MAG: hypothetical protein A2141_01595 [Candidatus Woesebacteria bacterium RBG_16_40_11]OGM27334.1 MAG: hypothetical protein A2628_00840 [Candidatus Woesebacteria bacterium RIFCSPHIGHO2_01_FULL_40_22]OGM36969.1 MAG: hypothetical protein A3E41_05850 [Candidatus Woesebacteria bacterium RIFCSPHIGHO2_12_FULL_38_9]OGM62506.1 MAG: hypothetical protein A3A76_02435 [Candidatus Woesebacteria bacterium RIFCSPLOWO2_01_FULL_39_23]